jgi:serine protease
MARPWSSSARVLNMSTHRITQILAVLAMLALPALAAAPIDSAFATGMRRASTPMVDIRHARVIVKFKADGALMRESALSARDPDKAPVQHAARLSQRLGLALSDGYAIAPRTQVLHAKDMSSAALVARLQADPDVEYAEVDERMRIAAAPNDPLYSNQVGNVTPAAGQWYLRPPTAQFVSSINAEAAWDTTMGSPAIVVADLDTGVRPDHPDLVGKLVPGYDFVSADSDGSFTSANDGNGRDPDPSDPGDWVTTAESQQTGGPLEGCDVTDSIWHGTQTAALIAAATNNAFGMASVGRNVRVMPVRVLGKCGGFQSDVIAGMYWAAGLDIPPTTSTGLSLGTAPSNPFPAKVLNMSLGSPFNPNSPGCPRSYQDAVNAVVAKGASVVVSAGNERGLAVGQPANCIGAIAVGGLRQTGTKVGFSDVGPEIAISSPGGNCVNQNAGEPCLFPILTATNTGTTVPATSTFSDSFNFSIGTSFSAPLVSGAIALMLSANPTLTPAAVRSTLTNSVRPFPPAGTVIVCHAPNGTIQDECSCTTTTCGAGMLDVRAAVLAVPAPTSTQALAFATPAAPTPGATITLDGSTSVPAAGRTITGYEWTFVNNGGIASFAGASPVTTLTATVTTTTAEGQFTVQLKVTDSNNVSTTTQLVVNVANPVVPSGNPTNPSGGGGGGSLSWPWLLGLCIAVVSLRPRRR